jgi:hypothetical protein
MKLIDPLNIPKELFPFLGLTTDICDPLSSTIRVWQKALFSHALFYHRPGYVASQDAGFKEKPIQDYMGPGKHIKLIGFNIDGKDRQILKDIIKQELDKHWWFNRYDIIGLISQAVPPLKHINIPWLSFCSEKCRDVMVEALPLYYGVRSIPKHSSPRDLNVYTAHNKPVFYYYGHYIGERKWNIS